MKLVPVLPRGGSRGSREWAPPPAAGQALVIVLGILAVTAILFVAFSQFMRAERVSGRSFADAVRAEQLVHVALARALEHVDDSMAGYCYPFWSPSHPDAMGSTGGIHCAEILRGGSTNLIPRSLWADVAAATGECAWVYIRSSDGRTNGRVAYLVANCSGLLDANLVGGANRTWSTNIAEVDLEGLYPEILDPQRFREGRARHRRYESVAELSRINEKPAGPASNLFTFSYDPGRDVYYTNQTHLGARTIDLRPKFRINDLGTYTNYTGPAFVADFLQEVSSLVARAGFSNNAADVAWNIVNYLDADRIPQTGKGTPPWLQAAGSEATPLVNEVALRTVSDRTNVYEVAVELWFPFFPVAVAPSDGFRVDVGVFDHAVTATNQAELMMQTNPDWSFESPIGSMAFGGPTEFLCFTSPPGRRISFPYVTTNTPPVTNYLPIGVSRFDPGGGTNGVPATNAVWILVRVSQDAARSGIVDQAMAELPVRFTNTTCWAVRDPRANHREEHWAKGAEPSLGRTNGANVCDAWAAGRQGLPIFHRDGPMANIGELGHIYCSDPDGPHPDARYWRNIDLLRYDQGAQLVDWMTVRQANVPARGLVGAGTRQEGVLRTLFHNVRVGHCSSRGRSFATNHVLTAPDIEALAASLGEPYLTPSDMLDEVGSKNVFRNWRPAGLDLSGDLKEDALRSILELISFRQNLFTIVLLAQPLGPQGVVPVAERRAVAVVCRDSYTGRSFVRCLLWPTE
jgi:hypothetical protein